MRSGPATYSPESFVVVSNLVPRSRSATITFALATTAPLGSVTVPTMLPASFCPHASVENARQAKVKRMAYERGEVGLLIKELLGDAGRRNAMIRLLPCRKKSYEALLLLSFDKR